MKVTITKIEYVDYEIDITDFIARHDCEFEYIDLSSPYFAESYNFDGYPKDNFIMIYQDLDHGMHELGYILCSEHPSNLKEYVKEHISEFVSFE